MELTPWNPWKELDRVQAEMEHELRAFLAKLRQSVPGNPISFVPPVDLVEADAEYRVYLALPGLVEEDIDLSLEGRELVIRGEREPLYDVARVTVLHAQGQYGFFERRIELPAEVPADAIQAAYEAGILTIRIPKAQEAAEREGPSASQAEQGDRS